MAMRARWAALIEDYLSIRQSLRGVVLIMDVRRPLQPLDLQLVQWCEHARLDIHVLLTKCDKLSRGARLNALKGVGESEYGDMLSLQLFSATKFIGVDEARGQLCEWLWGALTKKTPASQSGGKVPKPGPGKPGRGSRVKSRSGR